MPRVGRDRLSRPTAGRPSVAHFLFSYLFVTGSWLHAQLVHLRQYRPIVVTSRTENLDGIRE